jgi:hypothetical protein
MSVLYTNNAATLLTAAITTSSTTLSLTGGTGLLFPSPSAPDFFYVTVANNGGTLEIMKCTSRATDTLTVVRAQEGTTASAFSIGDKVELRVTAAGLANKLDKDTGGTVAGPVTVSGALIASSTLNVTGATTLASTLSAGASTLASASVTGNETVGGALNVTGATSLASTLAVTGAITATGGVVGNLTGNITGNATVGGTLGVTGATTLSGGATVVGGITGDTVAGAMVATTSDVAAGTSNVKFITPAALVGGSVFVSAWVRFAGQTTNGACTILKSRNVSSVTRTSAGHYTITFSSALTDANYAWAGSARSGGGNDTTTVAESNVSTNTSSSLYISVASSLTADDATKISVIVFD